MRGLNTVCILIGIKFDNSEARPKEFSLSLRLQNPHLERLLLPLGLKDIHGCKFYDCFIKLLPKPKVASSSALFNQLQHMFLYQNT